MKPMNKLATVVAAASFMGGCGSGLEQTPDSSPVQENAKRYFVLDEEIRNIPLEVPSDLASSEPQVNTEKARYTLQAVKHGGKLTLKLMGAMDELHPQINIPPILVKGNDYIATNNERLSESYERNGFLAQKLSVSLEDGQRIFSMGLPGQEPAYVGVKNGPDESAYVTLANSAEAINGPLDLRVAPVREDLIK